MAVTIIRDSGVVASSTSTATAAVSFAALPAAGNQIIASVGIYGTSAPGTISASDNQGGSSYSVAATTTNGLNKAGAAVLYRENISSPSGTFTVTFADGGTSIQWSGVIAYEVSGLPASASLDKTTVNSDVGCGSVTSFTPTASAALRSSDGVAFLADGSGCNTENLNPVTVAPSFTVNGADFDSANSNYSVSNKILTSSASVAPVINWTGTSNAFDTIATVLAVFDAGADLPPINYKEFPKNPIRSRAQGIA